MDGLTHIMLAAARLGNECLDIREASNWYGAHVRDNGLVADPKVD
eukprot:CAMPEP_0205927674 /NCGR_PEP_ID=MMETSP1325-20131115/23095_1 /ASSEMBLY_ACC=CAM_ASM_000708 /TAXON_ID=236786 /ORGANISM="Florenciella sp., Strain RCC1007" /LENGTH=44 /DNA_ID= /DNA_START= /DNA_END= /DNA_ORIENTATION=